MRSCHFTQHKEWVVDAILLSSIYRLPLPLHSRLTKATYSTYFNTHNTLTHVHSRHARNSRVSVCVSVLCIAFWAKVWKSLLGNAPSAGRPLLLLLFHIKWTAISSSWWMNKWRRSFKKTHRARERGREREKQLTSNARESFGVCFQLATIWFIECEICCSLQPNAKMALPSMIVRKQQ